MEGNVCIPNIGVRERKKRLTFGLVALGVSVVLAGALLGRGASRLSRLTLLLPLWMASLGYFQARGKT
jgi:hypothetical protein